MDWSHFKDFFTDEMHRKILSSVIIFFLTTVASFVVGRWWGSFKANREWRKKDFAGRIIVSLNNFSEGYLRIRTVFERSLEEVFINSAAVERVRAASLLTKEGQPILPIPKADRWFILNFVLNAIAEEYNEGLIRYDAAKHNHDARDPSPIKYLICLTCEAVGDDRIRKVRAMMIRKDHLLNLWEIAPQMPKLEQPWHSTRFDTLRICRSAYLQEPDNFLELEVYV